MRKTISFGRRVVFFVAAMAVLAGAVAWQSYALAWQTGSTTRSSSAKSLKLPGTKGGRMVRVKVFNSEGELVGPVEMPKVTFTAAEWRKKLTADQFKVLRSSGTERPFCGTLLDNKKEGIYTCAGCKLPLFRSDSKFESGTGWPSFFQPVAAENVAEREDRSHGMARVEVNCARCDGHLGHVFPDGPRPTGLRYCMNSESLEFTAKEDVKKLADPAAGE